MRIVHAADTHLDSPLRGLSRLEDDDVARLLRLASRRALENLVQLVIDEKAVALVLAGDIYDGDWPDYATGRFFAHQMDRLHDKEIPLFMAAGNHDAESEISRALRMPPNVTVLSTESPQTVLRDNLGLAVHGQGFATRAVTTNWLSHTQAVFLALSTLASCTPRSPAPKATSRTPHAALRTWHAPTTTTSPWDTSTTATWSTTGTGSPPSRATFRAVTHARAARRGPWLSTSRPTNAPSCDTSHSM